MNSAYLPYSWPQDRHRSSEEPVEPASTSGTTPGCSLKRYDELWFDDESVVLVAQNTGFRVFRSLLADQSTVLSDMFSSWSPDEGEELEGCPVIHLSDSATDVIYFLLALFKRKHQQCLSSSSPFGQFHQLTAIIRFAHKYHAQGIFDEVAISSLQKRFPSNFSTWEATHIKIPSTSSISVVNLARLVGKPFLLPTAFYYCALLGGNVLSGYSCPVNGAVEFLSPDDLKRCIDGRNTLGEEAVKLLSKVFITRPCEGCTTQAPCRSALQTMLESAVASDGASDPDILRTWRQTLVEWAQQHGLCDLCRQAAIERDVEARQVVWDSLPAIFDLDVEGWIPKASGRGGSNGLVAAAS